METVRSSFVRIHIYIANARWQLQPTLSTFLFILLFSRIHSVLFASPPRCSYTCTYIIIYYIHNMCVLYNMRVSVVPYHYCAEADTAVSHSIVFFFLCKNTRVIIISSLSRSHSLSPSITLSLSRTLALAHSIHLSLAIHIHTNNIVVRMPMNSTTTPTIVSVSLKFPGRLPPDDSAIEVFCRVSARPLNGAAFIWL